jgi:hypothetical protein
MMKAKPLSCNASVVVCSRIKKHFYKLILDFNPQGALDSVTPLPPVTGPTKTTISQNIDSGTTTQKVATTTGK